jgi:hypothetical protein
LAFNGQAFVVFDGNRLRGCHDAAAAINVVCHAKTPVQAQSICPRSGRLEKCLFPARKKVHSLFRFTSLQIASLHYFFSYKHLICAAQRICGYGGP